MPNDDYWLAVPVYEQLRDNLHHLVWLGLETARHNGGKLPPELHTYSFTRLRLTTHNTSNMSVETLCVLDVDAFLYSTSEYKPAPVLSICSLWLQALPGSLNRGFLTCHTRAWHA